MSAPVSANIAQVGFFLQLINDGSDYVTLYCTSQECYFFQIKNNPHDAFKNCVFILNSAWM
jgi:hypothetical protein